MSNPVPETIQIILAQLGRGLNGALVYCGGRNVAYKCAQPEGEYRSSYPSRVAPDGGIDYDVGLSFQVNGRRGENWTIVIAYEPDDTYSVYLWRRLRVTMKQLLAEPNRPHGEVIAHSHDVYCDTLKTTVELAYDECIKQFNQGFIPC